MNNKELKESIKSLGIKAKNASNILANISENKKNTSFRGT